MNGASQQPRRMQAARAAALLFAVLAATPPGGAQDRVAEFRQLASQIVQRRLSGLEENEADQKRTLQLLDALVLERLNAAVPDPEGAARALQSLVPQPPPVGEEYRLLRMGTPGAPWYLLQVNFGLAGPSALRLYAGAGNGASPYRLAAQIDRFAQPEYFDEFLAVAQVSAEDGVFLTVTGRTDELETGSFMAWRFDGAQLQRLWATELLEHSRYELSGAEFRLTYCQESDEDDLRKCGLLVRERYTWSRGWHLLERREVQP